MKAKKIFAFILITALAVLTALIPVGAVTAISELQDNAAQSEKPEQSTPILSPALNVIASGCKMRISGIAGMSVDFSEEDFLRAINLNSLESITVHSLPDPAEGELLLSGNAVKEGQTVEASLLTSLEFIPAGTHVTSSRFTFSANGNVYQMTGEIHVLDKSNSAPTVRDISVGRYVSAYTDVSYKGHLSGYDPDGDDVDYMIARYPKNGIIILNPTHGEYEYHPDPGFSGKDTFEYVIIDRYGAYSASETVVVNVEKLEENEKFVDMDDSEAYVEAIALSRAGLLGGRDIGGRKTFMPNEKMTRGEFISIIMQACGVEPKEGTVHTVFADDAAIHKSIRPAVASAYELGYFDPIYENDKMYFKPDDVISVAECASIISRILSIDTDISIPAASVIEGCPDDSYMAVSSLCSVAILPHNDGIISASSPLTREYAAKIIYNVKTFINLYASY